MNSSNKPSLPWTVRQVSANRDTLRESTVSARSNVAALREISGPEPGTTVLEVYDAEGKKSMAVLTSYWQRHIQRS